MNKISYESVKEVIGRSKGGLCKETEQEGLRTGFEEFDKLTGGFKNGELICLASRPFIGKTSLALSIVINACVKKAKTCIYFSLAESAQSILRRIISMDAMIPYYYLSRNDNLHECQEKSLQEDLQRTIHKLEEKPIYIDEKSLTLELIEAACRDLDSKTKIDFVIIDYLQRIVDYNEGNRTDEEYMLSRLKNLAKTINCPIIVLSQLSRSVEEREDHRPFLSDMRGTVVAEWYFDMIMFIYRDDYYHEETERKGIAEIIVAKNYSGLIGTVELAFIKELTRFEEWIPIENDYESHNKDLTDEQRLLAAFISGEITADDMEINEDEDFCYDEEMQPSDLRVSDIETVIDAQYYQSDIKEITEEGIELSDCRINFKTCARHFWNNHERGVGKSLYVGDRNSLTKPPYMRFIVDGKVIIILFPSRKDFYNTTEKIRAYGYETFDLS